MDCPQCGAEVPSDDAFCGKCGYARRDHAPERLDQSRIRMHETPDPSRDEQPGQGPSQRRARKHTVLGVAPGTPPVGFPAASPPSAAPSPEQPPKPALSPPPTSITRAGASQERGRAPQKTMLGIQPPEFVSPPADEGPTGPAGAGSDVNGDSEQEATLTGASQSHRARARVRYDSANEPLPVVERRKKALRGLSVLVLLAAAWLAYRYLTLHG